MAQGRLADLPAEVLVEICRHLLQPMQNERHGYRSANIKPETADALLCRAALARLMRTCRNLHDVAGCMLYSGYHHIWHPSDAPKFLKTLDPLTHEPYYNSAYPRHLSPDDTRRQLVRHVDIHNNMSRRSLLDVPWSNEQETITRGMWIEEMASGLEMPFPPGWNQCRQGDEKGPWDHSAEHINQLLVRYLSGLTSLSITLVFNWTFGLLDIWIQEQQDQRASPFRNLRRLKIHLRSLQARSFKSLQMIIDGAPYLSTLEIHETVSYRTPQHSRLDALRNLKFMNCSMDRGNMRITLQAVPNLTHFEYHHAKSNKIVDKQPLLTPQMLCHLLSNEYDLTQPPPRNESGKLVKAKLPDFHRQLRTVIIGFPIDEGMEPWRTEQTINNLRNFTNLQHLSIDMDSIVCKAQGKQYMTINNLGEMIPESLETLEITRVGGCLADLIRTTLPDLATEVQKGHFERLRRIDLIGCPGDKYNIAQLQHGLQAIFGTQQGPIIRVSGPVDQSKQSPLLKGGRSG